MPRVLHVLSQRPGLTGSGVTLDALVRHAGDAGWEQSAVIGTPASDSAPDVGCLPAEDVRPLVFGDGPLDFDVPGMSDVMPYPSTRFSSMSGDQLSRYRTAWRTHLETVVRDVRPDVIHAHHVWIMASLLKSVAPTTPVVNHCHSTGLRQMELCPHLTREVQQGCARNELFAVLHRGHEEDLHAALGLTTDRIRVIGAGYREDVFNPGGRENPGEPRLLYVGKLSPAKGLHSLLDAVDRLRAVWPRLELHIAGTGNGPEADALRIRMRNLERHVTAHGQLEQSDLARVMRSCTALVLPSFYEGLPLVLVEALACGCRLVVTDLPGVRNEFAPHLGDALELVPLPAMAGIDTPQQSQLPAFVDDLEKAIDRTLRKPPFCDPVEDLGTTLAPFTWRAVFARVESIWRGLL